MSRRRRDGHRSSTAQSLRAGASRLVWGLCAVAALVLAAAVLLRTLRADAGAAPWEQWFAVADLLTIGPVADVAVPDVALLRADAWQDAFGWSLAALGWIVVGLVLTLLVRPRGGSGRAAGRIERTHTRSAGDTVDE